jgi:hypothetical protein
MSYSYVGGGVMSAFGCAEASRSIYIAYKWGEGSILFERAKAERGIYALVAIKRVIINNGVKTYGQPVALYQDTLNTLWNEDELVTQDEAMSLANEYYVLLQGATLNAAMNC